MHKNLRRSFNFLTIVAVLFTSLGSITIEARAASTIFINEIHYDNTGTDSGEGVEIAGPAGTDLSGWSIVLYNGSNGAVYDTDPLSGIIPDQDNGYGVIWLPYPSNGLQNGAPDGIALVNNSGSLVQFLSYEGSFTAVGGPADGETSTDIGVSESGSTAVGESLQLTGGPGLNDSDFTWASAAANTFGTINAGQSFTAPPPPPIVINELDADQSGVDAAEFVELYDGGTGNTALDGYVLVFFNGSSDTSYFALDLDGQSTDANGYFVAGNAGVANVDVTFSGNFLQNGADAAAIYTGDDTDFPIGTAVTTTNLIDAIVYGTGDPDDAGLLVLLNASEPQVDEYGGGSGTTQSNQRCPNGTGGQRNTSTYAQFVPTPGSENLCAPPVATNMIINEVDADTLGTDVEEFVELYDGGTGNTALDGLVVVFYNGGGDTSYAAYDLDTYSTNANGYFILGNAGVTGVDITFGSNGLQNGADAVALYTGDATDFPNGTAVTTNNLLDAIVYDTSDGDDAELLTLLIGGGQVNEDTNDKDTESNQRCPNGSGSQRDTSSYAQHPPTPDAANTCGVTPPSVVINEFHADPDATNGDANGDGVRDSSQDEFVEIVNTGGAALDVSGWTLSDAVGIRHIFPVGSVIPAGCNIVVFGGGSPTGTFGGAAVQTASSGLLGLNNGGDTITLDDGISDVATSTYGSEGGDDQSLTLDPDITGAAFVKHSSATGSGGALYSPGTKIDGSNFSGCTPPVATNVIINEVDADQTGTDAAEFVELYDGGTGNTALDGLVVVFFNGSDDLSYTPAVDLDGYTTDAGGYFVLCGDAGNVPNCDLDITPDTNLIQNGADAVALYVGNDTDFPNDTPISTTNLIDAIVYDTNEVDDAGLLVLLNAGQPQVNEGSSNSTADSNQRCPTGTGGQRNTDTYAQYVPTPGEENTCSTPATIDLELTKTVDNNNPNEGDTINFMLTVSNVSTTLGATNVIVRDYLPAMPAEITSLSIGPCSQGSSVISLPNMDWTVGDLAAGASATCPAQVTVATGTDGTSFDNVAEVWSVTETTDADSIPGNLGASPAEDDEASVTVSVGVPAACGTSGTTLISAIQGTGPATPMDGSTVIIEGVVVGDFQMGSNLSGFFVQEEDADADANPASSEGVFVYDGGTPAVDVNVGDVVRVSGTVDEYFDLTEITSVTEVLKCGTGSATAATITLPVATLDVWEQHEGMLVTIPQTLYATNNYYQGRYGEVDLSVGSKLDNPTNVAAPGVAATALKELNDRSRIQMDDGSRAQNPPVAPYIGVDSTLRTGDTIPSLTGVLHYYSNSSGTKEYEIHPITPVAFTRVNARQATPQNVGGTVKLASFNVLNYFTTLDGSGSICGPAANQDCRGADNATEFTRQYTKIVSALTAMDADVIGLMEIENHPTDAALTDLVSRLNASAGLGTYAAISTGPIGTDAIKVALIYKPATVTPLGAFAILDSTVDATFNDSKNRPVLAQSFTDIASGEVFTVAVNHLKSKGSDCDALGDPDTGDGQGNCNITRTSAATAEVNWLASDPTGSGDPDFIIMGDLNAYAQEDPVTAIKVGGYTNLIEQFLGVGASSYQFYGEHGTLDHALATASLTNQITGVAEWHINGDEPSALDYNDYNQAYLYQPDAFRASDHDPVMVGIAMGAAPPVVIFGANTVPADGASLTTGPTQILVEFSKDVLNDGSAGAANNPANYMLVEALGDGFQTASCAAGPNAADLSVAINSASYSNVSGFIATVGINGGVPLPAGSYRFFVCGTTSITDLAGLELNGGLRDTVIDFTVGTASELPATGFPQGVVSPLAEQPQDMQYTETVMMLDIPSLAVSTPIVGVPIGGNGWDITWLGGNAGYLDGTAFPTWNGNTVITGHVWDANNQPGPFANVKYLNYGDTIQIRAWGLTYTYEVRETTTVRPWQVNSALREETYDWVTLVTCEDYQDGSQSYATRRIIRAVLVDVR
jgi:LPXTG-site transpeptidase (sortase) family protein